MNTSDIVSIIRECGLSGVSNITIGDMSISFSEQVKRKLYTDTVFDYNKEDDSDDVKEPNTQEIDVEELRLTDPLAYEEYLLEGE